MFKFKFSHADHVQEIYIVREHCDLIKNKILLKTNEKIKRNDISIQK